jgi:hypothetical protein
MLVSLGSQTGRAISFVLPAFFRENEFVVQALVGPSPIAHLHQDPAKRRLRALVEFGPYQAIA